MNPCTEKEYRKDDRVTSRRKMAPPRLFRWRLAIILALLAGGNPACRPAPPPPHSDNRSYPNIVLIIADDLGTGDVGCYGATKIKTPRLDRLAHEGILCTDAHSTCATCTPSRYALLTGRYHWRDGPGWNRGQKNKQVRWQGELLIGDRQPTIASLLKSSGYVTAGIGKWHLGFCRTAPDWNNELKPGPLEVGFDYFFGTPRTHNEPPFVFVESHWVVGLEKDDPIRIVPPTKTDDWGTSTGGRKAHESRPVDQIDLVLTKKAVDFLSQQRPDRPFFLYLPLLAPHWPWEPSKSFQGTSQIGRYGDYIQELDWCVGEILDSLKRQELNENTLVIFTSDNGALLTHEAIAAGHRSNRDLLGQKTDAWEGGHRVPFIARWPGRIPPGATSDKLISLSDMMATICAAADIPLPREASDSLNQLPLLTNPQIDRAIRTEMVFHGLEGLALRSNDWDYLPVQGSMGYTAPPTKSWGLPYAELGFINSDLDRDGKPRPEAPPAQLYNLRQDPRQSTNLYDQEPEVVRRLAERLREITGR